MVGERFALYRLAMAAGRAATVAGGVGGAWRAPATGITLDFGPERVSVGALMIGGLRLAAAGRSLAGVLFGLLTFKPQLGVLIPVALVAAGLWRAIAAAACVTALARVVASGLVFGFDVWPAWVHQMADYASGYDVVVDLMPTIYANVRETARAGPLGAVVVQLVRRLAVAVVVWRAFRAASRTRAMALCWSGRFWRRRTPSTTTCR